MKKLLTLLLLFPLVSTAQSLNLGARLGFNVPTTHSYVHETSGILLGGKMFLSFKKLEAGADFEAGSY